MLLYFCQNITRCSNLKMSQMHMLKYWILGVFFTKQSDDLATLPVYTPSETGILHSIT